MDPTFAHPHWIVAGILLILGGFWLFRWARRNDTSSELASATTEAAINKLLRKNTTKVASPGSSPAGKVALMRFRNSMAQFFGIVGVLMMMTGLVAVVFGVFYQAG